MKSEKCWMGRIKFGVGSWSRQKGGEECRWGLRRTGPPDRAPVCSEVLGAFLAEGVLPPEEGLSADLVGAAASALLHACIPVHIAVSRVSILYL